MSSDLWKMKFDVCCTVAQSEVESVSSALFIVEELDPYASNLAN